MKEGAWINAKTGQFAWIDEHARFIQREDEAKALGVPARVYDKIREMKWDFNGDGRESILATVMDAGFIRMRGHGSSWTFEFTMDSEKALWACLEFLVKFAGPFTSCLFNNLRTGESISETYSEFAANMEQDPRMVLRVAKVMTDEQYAKRASFQGKLKQASGYSRLMRIIKGLVPKVSTFGIISAENPGKPLTVEENNKRIDEMKKVLKENQYGYIQHKGVYRGEDLFPIENPFFVMNLSKTALTGLGQKFGQAAVIYGSVDHTKGVVTVEWIEGGTTIQTRTTSYTDFEADDFYSAYKGRKFKFPFFDDSEEETPVLATNVPKGHPSLLPGEVDDPENAPHLAYIYDHAGSLEQMATGQGLHVGGGMIQWGTRAAILTNLRKLKVK